MTYFIYNKFKNKVYYLYELNDWEDRVGNIEEFKTTNDGYILVDVLGLDSDADTNVSYENTSGGDGAQASNIVEENKKYTFNCIALNNGYNNELVTQVNKLYPNQFLYLGGINWATKKGFITTVVKSDDFSLEDGFFTYTSQSANKLFDVVFGTSVKDITFVKDVYEKVPTSASDTLKITVSDDQECIVKYPNSTQDEFIIMNKKNNNKFIITGSQTNIEVNAYDRTAISSEGNLFTLDYFLGGFIFLDQGENNISLDIDNYGDKLTVEVLRWRKTRRSEYV